jgi:hypothetical protein
MWQLKGSRLLTVGRKVFKFQTVRAQNSRCTLQFSRKSTAPYGEPEKVTTRDCAKQTTTNERDRQEEGKSGKRRIYGRARTEDNQRFSRGSGRFSSDDSLPSAGLPSLLPVKNEEKNKLGEKREETDMLGVSN